MEIIDFAVMNFAQQTLIEQRSDREELAGETQLETDASFDFCLSNRPLHGPQILQREAKRFFDNQMLARPSRGDDLFDVIGRITADRDDIYVGIGEQAVEIVINLDRATVFCA